jgi:ABC-type Fe3+/spermidine/putrescine transport system ATPase subunit
MWKEELKLREFGENELADNFLKIENLEKVYGKQKVLRDINFSVKDGEFIGILGPSGCGKTTLMRIIIGLEKPSGGRIYHNDSDITDLRPDKRGFSIVFQDYALFPHMTLYDNVAYGLKLRKVPSAQIKEQVMSTLKTLRLESAIKKYPSQLSGGMQQRASIARALVLNTKLLLLDEPFSALDALVKVDLSDELRDLQKQFNITMIMVTHDLEEAFLLSSRVILMNKGDIVADDTPARLYRNESKNEFVQSFIIDQINKRGQYMKSLEKA